MPQKIPEKYIPVSIEHESILRKFTILFILMSIIPMGILHYFYVEIAETGTLNLTAKDFNLTMIFVVLGVIVGYFAMRAVLGQLIDLTNANKKALEDVLSPEKIRELSHEKNEIAVLAQSFEAITTELEESVKNLNLAKKALHSIMERVSKGISNMENIDTFLELILETVTNAMSGKVGVLILAEKDGRHLWVKTVYGVKYDDNKVIRFTEEEERVFRQIGESKGARMFDHGLRSHDQQG
jgi:exonuclease VII small subunit